MTWYYLSFVQGGEFVGACVVEAATPFEAPRVAFEHRINPGGEVLIIPTPRGLPGPYPTYRLLTRHELGPKASLQELYSRGFYDTQAWTMRCRIGTPPPVPVIEREPEPVRRSPSKAAEYSAKARAKKKEKKKKRAAMDTPIARRFVRQTVLSPEARAKMFSDYEKYLRKAKLYPQPSYALINRPHADPKHTSVPCELPLGVVDGIGATKLREVTSAPLSELTLTPQLGDIKRQRRRA